MKGKTSQNMAVKSNKAKSRGYVAHLDQ